MLETVMIVVMCVGSLAFVGVFWLGILKAHSPRNTYIEQARWPLERYGRPTDAEIEEFHRAGATDRRIAFLTLTAAAATGIAVGWLLFDGAAALLAQLGVTYIAVWVFLGGGAWLRRRMRSAEPS